MEQQELSVVPKKAFKYDFQFISIPLSTGGHPRVAVHASALFNQGEAMSIGEAKRRAAELGGMRYAGRLPAHSSAVYAGIKSDFAEEYYAFKRYSRFALRLDIMDLRKKYKLKTKNCMK